MKASKAEIKSEKKLYPLHAAASHGRVDDIIKLIEQQHFDINEKLEFLNRTPLLSAAAEGQVEAVVYLLAKGADVYACDRGKANCIHKICFEINDDRTSDQQRARLRKTLEVILRHEKRLRETDANIALQHGYLLDDKNCFDSDPLSRITNLKIRKDIEDLIEEIRNSPVDSAFVVTEQKSPTASEQKQPGQPAVESLEKPRSSSDPSSLSTSSLRRRVPSAGAEALKSFQPDSSIGGNSPPPVSSKTDPVQKQQSGLLARIWSIFAPSEQTFASDVLSKNQEKTALLTKGK